MLTQPAKILSIPRISLITTQLSLCWGFILAPGALCQQPALLGWPRSAPGSPSFLFLTHRLTRRISRAHRPDRFTLVSESHTSRGHHSHCSLCPTFAHRHTVLPHLPFACSHEPSEACSFPGTWSRRRNFRARGGYGGGCFSLGQAARGSKMRRLVRVWALEQKRELKS